MESGEVVAENDQSNPAEDPPPMSDPPKEVEISPPPILTPKARKKRFKAEKKVPKSRIPVPTSVYVSSAVRPGFLEDLSAQVYGDEGLRKRRGRRGDQAEQPFDYGPPGILHRRIRRGSSSELGDSSVELLGPVDTLETDESDAVEELLGEGVDIHRAESDIHSDIPPSQRKKKAYHKIREDEEVTRDHYLPPSSRISTGEKKSVTWHGDDGTGDSRTPSRSISKSPVQGGEIKTSILKTPSRSTATKKPAKKIGGNKLPIYEDTSGQSSGGEGKLPPPLKPDRRSETPEKIEQKLTEEGLSDAEAGARLLELCKKCDWYEVDGYLRYFEKRVRNGTSPDPKPLATLKDEASGLTPLMYAVKDSRIPIVDRMIEMGCSVNETNKDGLAPIHLAALHSREEVIRFLITKKADIAALTAKDKQNVIHLATTRRTGNSAAILRTFLNALPPEARLEPDGNGKVPIFVAVEKGLRSSCQELLMHQREEQLKLTCGDAGDTPLHAATRSKNLEICRILADSGSDVNLGNVSKPFEIKKIRPIWG